MINSILSSLIKQESHRNYKRTWQEVSDIFLLYMYYKYIVYTSNKQLYPNVHRLAMNIPYIYYKINIP